MSDNPKCWFCGTEMNYRHGIGGSWYNCPQCFFETPFSSTDEETIAIAKMGMPPKVREVLISLVESINEPDWNDTNKTLSEHQEALKHLTNAINKLNARVTELENHGTVFGRK